MSLPVVHVVKDPAAVESLSGTVVLLGMSRVFISDLWYSEWSLKRLTVLRGVEMPDIMQLSKIRIDQVIRELGQSGTSIGSVYLTLEAAMELIPLMVQPQVPFALAEYNQELVSECTKVLRCSLEFKKR